MRTIKEVLRLRLELGLGQRQIAGSCGIVLSTVHDYLERVAAAEMGWPLPEGVTEEELESKVFGNQPVALRAVRPRPQPDWKTIHEQLQQHRHLTLQLLWQEYRQAHPDGYRYSWFCERHRHWRRHLDVVLRHEHKARRCAWGATIPVYDSTTGQAWLRCLWQCWAPVPTPTRKPRAISSWKPGYKRTSTPWNSSGACPRWRCPTTRKRR